ncbi:MAG: hypothetical protein HY775_05065 [Acidobacteria bacterium]|nr:hypothetical protein [Acidobacteriota bacterium]
MSRTQCRRVLLLCLAAAIVLLAGAQALAADGPTPPKISDPITGHTAPHGGYGTGSNFCIQCHAVHNAPGPGYALMAQDSVTATCRTCHGWSGGTPTTPPAGGPGGGTPGTVSSRSAYNLATPASGHAVGETSVPGETGIIITGKAGGAAPAGTASAGAGGLYCASCHSPHGDYGKVANGWVLADEGTTVSWKNAGGTYENRTLDWDGTNDAWRLCPSGQTPTAGAGYNASCTDYAQVKDAENQNVSLYGYKLLSAYPNHSATKKSYKTAQNNNDGAKWCATCHPSRLSDEAEFGGTLHNHPTGCDACHANPASGVGTSTDFPHTSDTSDLLQNFPDALCTTCHASGSLP